MKGKRIRSLAVTLCLAVLAAFAAPAVFAADETLDISYCEITGENFAADTYLGVDAIYNRSGASISCSELIERFYAQVYGLTVITPPGTPQIAQDGYWFEQTDDPQPNDVAYASAASRGSAHYAIVREVDEAAGTITLFEQNWRWDNKAGVGRKIAYSGSPYTFYTLKSAAGTPVLPEQIIDTASVPEQTEPDELVITWAEDAPSDWAVDAVSQAMRHGICAGSQTGFKTAVTRGAFAVFAVNAAQSMGVAPTSDDPYTAVRALGLMVGDETGNLQTEKPITREAAATVLVRFLSLFGEQTSADLTALQIYADRAAISDWARESAALLTQSGIMGGTGTGFSPKSNLTTEQALALFARIYEMIED